MQMTAELKYEAVKKEIKEKEIDYKKWEYETRKGLYLLSLPAMWFITIWVFIKKLYWTIEFRKDDKKIRFKKIREKTNFFFVDGCSSFSMNVKRSAADYKSLDLIYNYEIYRAELNGLALITSDFWCRMRNAQALRNRKRLIVEELSEILQIHKENGRKTRIFSIASGSAQAVFEAVAKAGIPVEVVLLDWNRKALDYSLSLMERMGLKHLISITVKHTRASKCGQFIAEFDPDVIEMVGYLDYLTDDEAVEIIRIIYEAARQGTHFLTANICPNLERFFLSVVINWSMNYRKAKKLLQLVHKGGFNRARVSIEPQGIHAVVISQK